MAGKRKKKAETIRQTIDRALSISTITEGLEDWFSRKFGVVVAHSKHTNDKGTSIGINRFGIVDVKTQQMWIPETNKIIQLEKLDESDSVEMDEHVG